MAYKNTYKQVLTLSIILFNFTESTQPFFLASPSLSIIPNKYTTHLFFYKTRPVPSPFPHPHDDTCYCLPS